MQTSRNLRRRVLLGTAAGALAIGGTTAGFAASSASRATPQQAMIADAAKQLKVTPAALTSALATAYRDELKTLVASKRITQKQADRLAKRAANGKVPLATTGARGVLGKGIRSKGALRKAAATYLGIDPKALRTELRTGKSLAQVATAHGKTAAGLKVVLMATVKARLDARVSVGRLTPSKAATRLARIGTRIDRLIAHVNHAPAASAT